MNMAPGSVVYTRSSGLTQLPEAQLYALSEIVLRDVRNLRGENVEVSNSRMTMARLPYGYLTVTPEHGSVLVGRGGRVPLINEDESLSVQKILSEAYTIHRAALRLSTADLRGDGRFWMVGNYVREIVERDFDQLLSVSLTNPALRRFAPGQTGLVERVLRDELDQPFRFQIEESPHSLAA